VPVALAPPARAVLAPALEHADAARAQFQADRAIAGRAQHTGPRGPVTLHHRRARQREAVVGAGGEDHPARRHRGDEPRSGRRQAAVVRHHQQVRAQVGALLAHQPLLDLRADVAGQQRHAAAGGAAQHAGAVVAQVRE
jgi:hypothetical protein